MTLINAEAVTSEDRRERSYSEAEAQVIHFKANSFNLLSGIAMGTDTSAKPKAPTHNTMHCARKQHHRHHHHRNHNGDRPRSKSLDLYGVRKKKHPQQYKHVPRTHSPGRHHYVSSSSPSVPKLKGNLWIRPAATTAFRGHAPLFFPAIAGVPTSPSLNAQQWIDGEKFLDLSPLGVSSLARHVSNDSSYSRSWLDNATVLCASPGSSSNSYLRLDPGPTRIIFGESGKPIKSRSVFEHFTS